MKIVLNTYNGRGINGIKETVIETNDNIDWDKKVQTIKGINHTYDEYPSAVFHGTKTYIIPTSSIAYIVE